jgi:hypothetical protein
MWHIPPVVHFGVKVVHAAAQAAKLVERHAAEAAVKVEKAEKKKGAKKS